MSGASRPARERRNPPISAPLELSIPLASFSSSFWFSGVLAAIIDSVSVR
jgi:hypothetical protein